MQTVTRNACDHAASARFSRILALFTNSRKTREFVIFRIDDEPAENPYAMMKKNFDADSVKSGMIRLYGFGTIFPITLVASSTATLTVGSALPPGAVTRTVEPTLDDFRQPAKSGEFQYYHTLWQVSRFPTNPEAQPR